MHNIYAMRIYTNLAFLIKYNMIIDYKSTNINIIISLLNH